MKIRRKHVLALLIAFLLTNILPSVVYSSPGAEQDSSLLFIDEFTEEPSPFWKTGLISNSNYTTTVENGKLKLSVNQSGYTDKVIVGDSDNWKDYTVQADVYFDHFSANGRVEIKGYMSSGNDSSPGAIALEKSEDYLLIKTRDHEGTLSAAHSEFNNTFSATGPNHVKLEFYGDRVEMYINEVLIYEGTGLQDKKGMPEFSMWNPQISYIDNFTVRLSKL